MALDSPMEIDEVWNVGLHTSGELVVRDGALDGIVESECVEQAVIELVNCVQLSELARGAGRMFGTGSGPA